MHSIYKIILALFIITASAFALSPLYALNNISNAAQNNDTQQWQTLIKTQNLQPYIAKLLTGMADMKMYAEIRQNPKQAMMDNQFAKEQIPRLAGKFADPQGIKHLLCGEVTNDPHEKADKEKECWQLDGSLSWQSLTRTTATFNNPQTHWQSSLILERTGLFTWQVIDVELPVEAILERFAKNIGLEK